MSDAFHENLRIYYSNHFFYGNIIHCIKAAIGFAFIFIGFSLFLTLFKVLKVYFDIRVSKEEWWQMRESCEGEKFLRLLLFTLIYCGFVFFWTTLPFLYSTLFYGIAVIGVLIVYHMLKYAFSYVKSFKIFKKKFVPKQKKEE